MHCAPKMLLASSTRAISFLAAEFMQTLSAPEFNKSLISWEVLIPPPTVRGTKHSDEAHSINSVFGCRFSLEAVISNITISSTSHFTKILLLFLYFQLEDIF